MKSRLVGLPAPYDRLAALLALIGLIALMLLARGLEPSPTGYGTHQQLGLPPCGSLTWLGLRCPACGMTTAWSYASRGRWLDAWHSNAGGAMLMAIALAYIPIIGYLVARGRWSHRGWMSSSLALCLASAIAVAVIQWACRAFGPTG